MKPPKEIKKDLGRCLDRWAPVHFESCESDCPYHSEGTLCKSTLHSDVIAYIQQLEAGIDHAEKVARECAKSITENLDKLQAKLFQLESDNESKQKRIEELESRLAQVERERDAAVKDIGISCDYCAYAENPFGETPCMTEEEYTLGKMCNGWKWRGVCAENTKRDSE